MHGTTRRTQIPAALKPQLCRSSAEAPEGEGWLHEIKYDGYRLLARKSKEFVRLYTRSGKDWTCRLPEIATAIAHLKEDDLWMDGELVVADAHGIPDFEALQRSLAPGTSRPRMHYHIWDLPFAGGESLAARPLLQRKDQLNEILERAPTPLAYTGHVLGGGGKVFAGARRMGLEGIVSKRTDSRYLPGRRPGSWLKVKCWCDYRAPLAGFDLDTGGRIAALLVGDPGGQPCFGGRIELGLHRLRGNTRRLMERTRVGCPFGEARDRTGRIWVEPGLAVRFRALPVRPGRPLRHAVLEAIEGT